MHVWGFGGKVLSRIQNKLTMNNLTIRRATFSDVERIVEFRLLLQKHAEKSNPRIWRVAEEGKKLLKQKVEDDLANGNIRVLLAETGGKAIGYVQGEVTRRSDYVPETVGHISIMYVVKQFRIKGVGRCLMKELCKFFSSNKVEDLTVRYIIGNKEAEGFWKKLGFESIITTSSTYPKELDAKLGPENE
jgi:ribosomal protein S18 acetylase RimI-like enzyme